LTEKESFAPLNKPNSYLLIVAQAKLGGD